MQDAACTVYATGHIYEFKDGMHRCACGATTVFNEFSREWK